MQIEQANPETWSHRPSLVAWMSRGAPALFLVFLLAAPRAAAAQQPLPELSLEELMRIDAGRVFGASERLQPVISTCMRWRAYSAASRLVAGSAA